MLRYRILCVGRRANDPLLDVADEYLERLNRYAKTELLRVKDGTAQNEERALRAKLLPGYIVVALDERGRQRSTEELAAHIGGWLHGGTKGVVFLIGGADGLHPSLKDQADETLALSRLTLPHRLALTLLLEQLYRSHTILRGESYHRP